MNRIVVLMYHALYEDARGLDAIAAEDRPYAVSTRAFARQLDMLRDAAVPVIDPAQLETGKTPGSGVILTFDDGHASNAELALPLLAERGLTAAFFVTTGFIGQRPGYCSWEQLRTLSRAGMLVGGHGHTHRFLSDLDAPLLHEELQRSHTLLQDGLHKAIAQMSFPGGRYNAAVLRDGLSCGFHIFHGSGVGTLRPHSALTGLPLPRIAVRQGMTDTVFLDYALARSSRILRARSLDLAKGLAKNIIGNERYHQLYAKIKS